MKKLIPIILVVIIVVAAIIIVPKYMHTCDDCGKFFMGYAYEPSIADDLIGEVTDFLGMNEEGEKLEKICKDCAEKHHFLTDPAELDQFKIDPWG